MRLVIQRVAEASVTVDGEVICAIGRGLAILVGVRRGDREEDADALADKAFNLRIFDDGTGKMNRAASDADGSFLAVSQFTLYADTRRGRRPSFVEAADPEVGNRVYERFVSRLRARGGQVSTGRFGVHMAVQLVNDGPVTIILDSDVRS